MLLFPGLVAAAVFYSLTSHPRPNEFERVVQALVFTAASHVTAWPILAALGFYWIRSDWPAGTDVFITAACGVILALATAYVSNHDTEHRVLRYLKITRETSYPSEWYSAFAEHDGRYAVLHLTGGRRLYGWPEEWPSRPDQGHFRIADCEWITDSGSIPVAGVSAIVVSVTEVELIEFLDPLPDEHEE